MGRRKIEIKAIKDDRNRSVTFLKRKGGLFKKAYELSVLCSVDVAVIIFGHNKKLYEFSSGDIHETLGRYQYYGTAHEHKGPSDFAGKRDLDDEEDEDATPPADEHLPPNHPMMPPQLQNQPSFQHMRGQAPSASPPIPNGLPFQPRHGTPQPQMGSRPSSRNTLRRVSANYVSQGPPQVSQPPPPGPNGFAYMPNPPIYNPQAPPMQGPPHATPPQYQYAPPPQHIPQVQHAYMQDQRRQSMPPAFPQQQPQPPRRNPSPPQPQPQQQYTENQGLSEPKHSSSRNQSIYTPIDDRKSVLAQHFMGASSSDQSRNEVKPESDIRSNSIDVGAMQRNNTPASQAPPPMSQSVPVAPQHSSRPSVSSVSDIQPLSRTNSSQFGGKRPRLKVQIPDEQSDAGSPADPSSRHSGEAANGTPARGSTDASHSSGVVLPPPSPSAASASALLSAGATGPGNPFARPPPPNATNQNNTYQGSNSGETPISALPTRVMPEGLLPSPSQFYPDWGFGRTGPDSAMLPSPLTFPTPIAGMGPSFLREDDESRKRKSPEGGSQEGSAGKKVKT
ncbi:MAG: hypothetical protein M1834_004626 [Cirrosporium novae-zelandiae]|nr:MAG: hypothetical protein M1834_004626 [Cirrosporium novae-zelandiae]